MMKKKFSSPPAPRRLSAGRNNAGKQPNRVVPVALQDKESLAMEEGCLTIDQKTSDQQRSEEDLQFGAAMDYYKRDNRRPFPTWSEALEVLHALGYRKVATPTPSPGLHVVPLPNR